MTRFRFGVTVVVWALLAVALAASDMDPQVLVLGGLVSVVSAVGFVGFDLIRPGRTVRWASAPRPHETTTRDEAVSAVVRQITRAHRSSSPALRDTLLELVDRRLLERHGIDRVEQPAAARAVLTPRLIRLGDEHRVRIAGLGELDVLLSEIDAI